VEIAEDEVGGGGAGAVEIFDGSGGEEIAGDLFGDELVEGKVAVIGIDHVVAVAPGVLEDEAPERDGFSETGDVEPMAAPTFAEMRGGEQSIDEPFEGGGGMIVQKRID